MANASDRIADDMVSRQLQILRFSEGLSQRLIRELRAAEAKIEKLLLRTDLSRFTVERTRALLDNIRRILADFAKQAYDESRVEIGAAAALAASRAARDINAFLSIDIIEPTLDARKLIVAMNDISVLGGATMKEYWQRFPVALQQAYAGIIRNGVATGMTSADLIKALKADPGISSQINSIRTLVRTSSMTMANEARMAMYAENDDLIKGIQWLSTLDSRTSVICRALDGLMWDNDRQPIDHGYRFPGATAHPNCRSTQIPVLRSFAELATRNKGLASKLDAALSGRTRASMDGQVASDLTYDDWLRTKSEAFARKVLGDTRYELWSAGRLSMRDMLDQSGHPITVAELEEEFAA